jgi:hypothetical protein
MDIKKDVEVGLEKVERLRDEARVQLHLASLDVKKEWDEDLEPRIAELEGATKHATESTRSKIKVLLEALEDFVTRLRTITP